MTTATAGYQSGFLLNSTCGVSERMSAMVLMLRGGHEIVSLGEKVVEGNGSGTAVPGSQGLLPTTIPFGALLCEWDRGDAIL